MNWPRCTALPFALLSLGVLETPGFACGDSGVRLPGAPCPGQRVTQEPDLSFSIRSTRPVAVPPLEARSSDRRRAVALGDGLKVDAAIFARLAPQEKEVSDANHR